MNILNVLGLSGLLATLAFTYWAAFHAPHTVGQSPRSRIVESWTNLAVGYAINFVANILLLPLVGVAHLTLWDNFMLGWIYTFISIGRQFIIRTYYNWRLHRHG